MAPGVCKTTDGSQQTLSGRKGDTCSYTVPFPFKLLLQFKAGAVKALTARPPSPTLCPLGWYKVGRNPRALYQGPPSFQGHKLGGNVCPVQSVRCTLLLYQIGPPLSVLLEEVPSRNTSMNGRTQPRFTQMKLHCLTQRSDQKFGFFFF